MCAIFQDLVEYVSAILFSIITDNLEPGQLYSVTELSKRDRSLIACFFYNNLTSMGRIGCDGLVFRKSQVEAILHY